VKTSQLRNDHRLHLPRSKHRTHANASNNSTITDLLHQVAMDVV
jgi:hypothetical protein